MLELKNIVKVYPSGGENIRALKGVDLKFRNNEFVSILGPSGCGKTTMLNIIGGLDQYTEGDLIINGRSTRLYKDRDWDTYRNHSIGFVFQSYNLIPHQTVLSNVELALTLSGVSKRERKERAKKALEAVGLGTQLKKRPAQMSGGQMQRVAIARAIVNDPDIILADEPTGALDSETSIQVMNILKEIAGDRLVVMVTHNPELAYEYSTRIIRMLDGRVLDDSKPIGEEELALLRLEDEAAEAAGSRKAAIAAAKLAQEGVSVPENSSAGEVNEAEAETVPQTAPEPERPEDNEAKESAEEDDASAVPAAAAAVFGIAGADASPKVDAASDTAPEKAAGAAAAVLAGSAGNKKKKKARRASMSLWTSFGLSLNNLFTKKGRTLLTAFAGSIGIIGIALIYAVSQGTSDYIATVQEDTLASYPLTITTESIDISTMLESFVSSTEAAKENGEENTVVEQAMVSSMIEGVGTNDLKSLKQHLDANRESLYPDVTSIAYSYSITPQIYTIDVAGNLLQANPNRLTASMGMGNRMSMFSEILADRSKMDEQYDILMGRWPENRDELVLVLNDPGRISDLLTYTIGIHDPTELADMVSAIMNGETPPAHSETPLKWTYDELMQLDLRLVLTTDLYRYDSAHRVWEDMRNDKDYMNRVYDNSLKLHVTAIAIAKDSSASALSVGFNYLPELPLYVMEQAAESRIVKMQQADESVNVFSGKPFGEEDSESGLDFKEMINVDEEAFAGAFHVGFDASTIRPLLSAYLGNMSSSLNKDREAAGDDYLKVFRVLAEDMLNSLISEQGGTAAVSLAEVDGIAERYLASAGAQQQMSALAKKYNLDQSRLETVTRPLLSTMLSAHIAGSGSDITLPELPEDPGTPETPGETPETPQTFAMVLADPEEPGVPQEPGGDPEPGDGGAGETPETPDGPDVPGGGELPGIPSADDILNEVLNRKTEITSDEVPGIVNSFMDSAIAASSADAIGTMMIMPALQSKLTSAVASFAAQLMKNVMGSMSVDEDAIANAFQFDMTEADMTRLITALNGGSGSNSAENNLHRLGYADKETPTSIYVYLKDFEAKDRFKAFIEDYNTMVKEAGEEEKVVRYTDITGVLMSSVTTIVDAVTYVLIAFVAISLLVSSIMIGVITLISVQERTKEIGILRAIGASKRNVSSMFNAETVIIGFSSGMIGVLVTYLMCIPINIILHRLTNISYLNAKLPIWAAVTLVLISVLLTLFAGIIPSRSAAKKDPVVALRSE